MAAAPAAARPAAGAVEADPRHYAVELENDRVRVVRIRYGTGERSVMHSHPASVVVLLTDALTRMHAPDGSAVDVPGKRGQVMWLDAHEHLPENIGGAPFEGVLVELKHGESGGESSPAAGEAEEIKALQRRYYQTMDARGGAPAVVDEFFAPAATVTLAGVPPVDLQGFKGLLAGFYNAFPDMVHHIVAQVAEGDLVTARNVVTATHRGEFQGIPASGKRVTIDAMVMQRITAGRITEMWANVDLAGLTQLLKGAAETPAS